MSLSDDTTLDILKYIYTDEFISTIMSIYSVSPLVTTTYYDANIIAKIYNTTPDIIYRIWKQQLFHEITYHFFTIEPCFL